MDYNFDEVIDRKNTFSKWDMRAFMLQSGMATRYDDDTIPLFTADMDFRCAPSIQNALQEVVDHNIYGYSMLDGSNKSPYTKAISGWFYRRHNWSFDEECISYISGTITGLKNALLAVTKPGDGVLITLPIYTPFMGTVKNTGRKMVNSQLINCNGYYTIDFEDFERKASDPDTKAFLLCNPHNPTGRVWTAEELKRIYDICYHNNVVIISDELHGDIVRKGQKFLPIAQLTGGKGIITCTGLGKTFNIAGIHCSNVIITDENLLDAYRRQAGMNLPTIFSIAATIGAYNGGDQWVDAMNDYIDGNIEWAYEFVKTNLPEVVMTKPEGTYILWLDFNKYGLDYSEVNRRISEDANVLLEHGQMFDPSLGYGFERICTPTRRSLLQDAFTRIALQFP